MGCSSSSDATGAPRPRPEAKTAVEAQVRSSRRDSREKSLAVTSTLSGVELRSMQRNQKSLVVGGVNSQAFFSKSDQTIIIFDWDDTLCPSTAIKRFARFDRKGRPIARMDDVLQDHLSQLQDQLIPLLQLASQLGKVILVTNAKRPWVDISCKAFLPALVDTVQQIPTTYAVELLQQDITSQGMAPDVLLTETKMRAMKAAVTNFYSRYPGQSWKNIVSVGDALFEHNAVRQVVEEYQSATGGNKKCRTKTVKLLDGPTASGLMIQVSIVGNWLRKIVEADYDVNIDFSADEATVNGWVAEFSETAGMRMP